MNQSLAERYCLAVNCPTGEFVTRIFWRCLHRHGVLLAPFTALLREDYFAPDRDLIGQAGRSQTLVEIDEAIAEFISDSRNRTWWRGPGRVRISTKKLRRLSRLCFAVNPGAALSGSAR